MIKKARDCFVLSGIKCNATTQDHLVQHHIVHLLADLGHNVQGLGGLQFPFLCKEKSFL